MPARKNPAPRFFANPVAWRAWLAKHHAHAPELLVGFHKKHSGEPSITWPQSVDEALSFGWIDGVRRRIDEDRYSIRFTPRRAGSIWSSINIARIEVLRREGRLHEAGEKAFARREAHKSGLYSFEQKKPPKLTAAQQAQLRDNEKAWAFFQAQPPGYQRMAAHWVTEAKQESTRARRLQALIDTSATGLRLPQFVPYGKR